MLDSELEYQIDKYVSRKLLYQEVVFLISFVPRYLYLKGLIGSSIVFIH